MILAVAKSRFICQNLFRKLRLYFSVTESCTKQKRPTKRALDGWDSAAFSGFSYTQAESCSRSFIHARPPASNANRWATQEQNAKLSLIRQFGLRVGSENSNQVFGGDFSLVRI